MTTDAKVWDERRLDRLDHSLVWRTLVQRPVWLLYEAYGKVISYNGGLNESK